MTGSDPQPGPPVPPPYRGAPPATQPPPLAHARPGWGEPALPSALPAGLLDGQPLRLHPLSPVLDLILSARQWAFPLVILVLGSGRSLLLGPAAVFLLAAVVAWKVLAWSRFTYRLHDDVLTVESGVLQRSRREVPLSRIQQVDLRRRLRHRALGVAVVQIDTAGGGSGAEVVLEAVADSEAQALRTALLRRAQVLQAPAVPTAAPGVPSAGGATDGGLGVAVAAAPVPGVPPIAPSPPPTVVTRLGLWDLIVAGVSGSRLAALLPLAGAAWGLLIEAPGDVAEDLTARVPTSVTAMVVFAVALLPLAVLAAAASSVLTDYDFTLERVGTDLHLRRGLLDQREAMLSLHRIQAVRIHENPLRRALGIAAVQLQSAGSGAETEGAVTRVTIPYVRRRELDSLLAQVLPVPAAHPPLVPAPPAARRRSWVRRVLAPSFVLVVLLGGLWALDVGTSPTLAVVAAVCAAVVLPLLVTEAEMTYRNLGHVGTPSLVVARGGGFVRSTALIPVAKTQSTRLRSSPFQRRSGLATLFLDVAGRGEVPAVVDGDASKLAVLRRSALHGRAAREDEQAVRRRTRGERTS